MDRVDSLLYEEKARNPLISNLASHAVARAWPFRGTARDGLQGLCRRNRESSAPVGNQWHTVTVSTPFATRRECNSSSAQPAEQTHLHAVEWALHLLSVISCISFHPTGESTGGEDCLKWCHTPYRPEAWGRFVCCFTFRVAFSIERVSIAQVRLHINACFAEALE